MSLSKKFRSFIFNFANLQKLEKRALERVEDISPVVTLTSVPKRIINIKPTIISLLKQDLPPKKIVISLGSNIFEGVEIPKYLSNSEIITIQFIEKDMGPATKFLETIKREDKNQLIVVVDDDMYYSKDLLSTLVKFDQSSDGNTSFCVNGLRVPRTLFSKDRESDKEIKNGQKRVAIVEGCGGYTIRPRYFDLNLFQFSSAPKRAMFDDDFWISGHMSKNNIQKIQIPLQGRRRSLVNTIESAISGDREALQSEMMQYFSAYWKAEEYSN